MDGGIAIIDKLITGQVHSVSDLEKLRLEYLHSNNTITSVRKNLIKIDNSSLSIDLKAENKAFMHWILGQYKNVIESLKNENISALAKFILGHSHLCRSDYKEAVQKMEESLNIAEPIQIASLVDAYLGMNRVDDAVKLLAKVNASDVNNKYIRYGSARIKEFNHELDGAISIYQNLIDEYKDFHLVAFRLANLYDLLNEDVKAINIYLKSIPFGYAPVNSLVNLGLLLEDDAHYARAIACFKKALEFDPSNPIIRLHLENSIGSQNMIYDERRDHVKKQTEKILGVPISDFELSVRSRNCLSKMSITTLGELVNKTEEELLSYKNFGETSLKEIKEMLSQRNLALKSSKEELQGVKKDTTETTIDASLAVQRQGIAIESLQISLRSRKCLERLKIHTLEEITRYSKDDLMAMPNFGQTSYDEIMALLTQNGLSLKS